MATSRLIPAAFGQNQLKALDLMASPMAVKRKRDQLDEMAAENTSQSDHSFLLPQPVSPSVANDLQDKSTHLVHITNGGDVVCFRDRQVQFVSKVFGGSKDGQQSSIQSVTLPHPLDAPIIFCDTVCLSSSDDVPSLLAINKCGKMMYWSVTKSSPQMRQLVLADEEELSCAAILNSRIFLGSSRGDVYSVQRVAGEFDCDRLCAPASLLGDMWRSGVKLLGLPPVLAPSPAPLAHILAVSQGRSSLVLGVGARGQLRGWRAANKSSASSDLEVPIKQGADLGGLLKEDIAAAQRVSVDDLQLRILDVRGVTVPDAGCVLCLCASAQGPAEGLGSLWLHLLDVQAAGAGEQGVAVEVAGRLLVTSALPLDLLTPAAAAAAAALF
eukprot:gene43572-53276_t